MTGPAGTGKTLLALYLGMREVENRTAERVVVVRSIVPTRDVGFLPGTIREKAALYETPYHDLIGLLYDKHDAYANLKGSSQMEFLTTSFVRGITLRDSVVVIDEAENLSYHELDSVLTRVGENTRVIVCGDPRQSDLKQLDQGGFEDFCRVLSQMESFSVVEFGMEDVRRSAVVREYLCARKKVLGY
jgi:predicted ribonuclease YlaK